MLKLDTMARIMVLTQGGVGLVDLGREGTLVLFKY